jgi:hypothetical protein
VGKEKTKIIRKGITKSFNTLSLENVRADEVAYEIKNKIIDGDRDENIKTMVFLKRMEKVTKVLLKDSEVKDIISKNVTSFNKDGNFAILGASVKMSDYTRYDYSTSKHPELDSINDIIKQLQSRKKQIQKELAEIKPGESKIVECREIPNLEAITVNKKVEVYAPTKNSKPIPKFRT